MEREGGEVHYTVDCCLLFSILLLASCCHCVCGCEGVCVVFFLVR